MPIPQWTSGDWLQIFLLAMIWGLSFFLTEICLRDLGPLSIAAGRVATAAAALLAVAVLAGHRLPVRLTDWAALAFMGLIRSAEHTSALQSLRRLSYADYRLQQKQTTDHTANA